MKISELIKELKKAKKQHGDLPVCIFHEWLSEANGIKHSPMVKNRFGYMAEHIEIEFGDITSWWWRDED